MARIRTIKPEFWVDDVMVEMPFVTRLLFIGLWNFVDDEGYIEDKPRRIKMQVFPADDVRVEDSLKALEASGRLIRYESDQGPLLRVANWERHQRISHAARTRFTGITRVERPSSRKAREDSGALRPEKEGKGIEETTSLMSEVADATTRPDVEHLLGVLDEEIVRNGGKKPNRTKKNRDAARLLLDRDGKTVEQVEKAIRWAQGNEFWRANILSMSKLREKYDQLQLQAKRSPGAPASQSSGRREEVIDGILWVNGAPTIGGPRGMTNDQYEAWLVETGRG